MKQFHILTIDDDPKHLSAVRRVLKRSGYEVSAATCGRHGLRVAANRWPDLILVDVSMPGMSGHEFVRRFRRIEGRRHTADGSYGAIYESPSVPIIFLSARSLPHQRVSGLDSGAVDYVIKPFDAQELRARVRVHLKRYEKECLLAAARTGPGGEDQTASQRGLDLAASLLGGLL